MSTRMEEATVAATGAEEEEVAVQARWRSPYERVARMASGNAVVVFSASGCCMCHVVKQLLLGLGVGPTVYELDQEKNGGEIQAVLCYLIYGAGGTSTSEAAVVPAVFVGGKLLGGVEKVMSSHISGSLVPLLKQAGALWL
ncbi:glutaredoxin-C5 [Canna indica]|uniref:Glutaredoxin-C5 n=1 Tax=Canna indica TaxID=4628 RepID=A0AAQ3KFH2_9LILI|nr:glutaredoxin-C5 [Canna indica]